MDGVGCWAASGFLEDTMGVCLVDTARPAIAEIRRAN